MTLIDYPGKVACTIFTVGCNFRCPFCYSGELVLPEKQITEISEKDIFNFLKERQGLLDGCVICGGEPTINEDLPDFIIKIKKLGYLVKLDTNGSSPEMLEYLIINKMVDYVAMDIKSSRAKYSVYTGRKVDLAKIERSINQLKKNEVSFEFRTTVAPGLTAEDILAIAEWISGPGVNYFLQKFVPEKELLDPEILKQVILAEEEILSSIEAIRGRFKNSKLR